MAEPIQLVRNDTQPQVRLRILDSGGSQPLDLRGKTVKVFIRKNPRQGVALTKKAHIFPKSAQNGYAFVVWRENDLNLRGGGYEFEVEVSDDFGFRHTCFDIFEIEVRDDFA